jgi:hypothetical protein
MEPGMCEAVDSLLVRRMQTLQYTMPWIAFLVRLFDESDSQDAMLAPAEANKITAQQIQYGPLITAAGQCVAAGTSCPYA